MTTARGLNVSPGTYTREIEIPYSVKSLGLTTLGLVGETLIGPAFQPIQIQNFTEFQTWFGNTNTEKYKNGYPRYELPYIAKSYLTESNSLYVTRVLGLSGYKYDGLWALYNDTSGNTVDANTVLATFRSKSAYKNETGGLAAYVTNIAMQQSTGITSTNTDFDIVATMNTVDFTLPATVTYNVSLNPSKKNYILKVLGNTPNGSNNSYIFVEEMFETTIKELTVGQELGGALSGSIKIKISTKQDKNNNYLERYRYAQTPWFVSEVKGNKIIPLFRCVSVTDGENANNMFKISIINIDKANSKFDLIVRSINDTDANPIILESYKNCSMNPNVKSEYIGNKIGTVDQNYQVKSKYIILDINTDDPLVSQSVPMGFSGYEVKDIDGTGTTYQSAKIIYNTTYDLTLREKKQYFGLSDLKGVDNDFFKYNGQENITHTRGFHMESATSTNITGITLDGIGYENARFDSITSDQETIIHNDKRLMKFTTYMYGGFDGWDVWRENRTNSDKFQVDRFTRITGDVNGVDEVGVVADKKQFYSFTGTQLENEMGIPNVIDNNGMSSDFYAWWSAIRSFSNPEAFDINLLATPGIDILNNTLLVNETLDMIHEERKDCLYIVTTPDKAKPAFGNPGLDDTKTSMFSATNVVDSLSDTGVESDFAATYFPWCKYNDTDNDQYVYLPVTRDIVKNIAKTDNVAYSWFAPAGYSRGNVDCVNAKKNLILSEENELIEGRINIVKTFAKVGVKIWSQKTLSADPDSQLSRIGVRRMMLYLRKLVRTSSLPLIFEPNDDSTKNKLTEIISPILNGVVQNRGISEYKIQIDDSAEAKAKYEMNVTIWVKPIGALEFINIDFVITPNGFDFNSI